VRPARTLAVVLGLVTAASGSVLAQSPAGHAINPSQVGVLVLNGTHRPGLAARTSAALARRGFAVATLDSPWIANAPATVGVTQIYFDATRPTARLTAERLRQALRQRSVIRHLTGPIARLAAHAGRPPVVVVLGTSFAGFA